MGFMENPHSTPTAGWMAYYPDPQSRLYVAGKAKTSFLISFDKTYELGVY